MSTDTTVNKEEGFWVSAEEKQQIEEKLVSISDFQRFSSLLIWLSLLMVILHIFADLYFHIFA